MTRSPILDAGELLQAREGTLEVEWQEHFDCFVRLEPNMLFSLQVLDQDLLTSDRQMAESGAMPDRLVSGLKWERLEGTKKPSGGRQLNASKLSAALATKQVFTQQEWDAFGIQSLRANDYIKVEGRGLRGRGSCLQGDGIAYFKPVDPEDRGAGIRLNHLELRSLAAAKAPHDKLTKTFPLWKKSHKGDAQPAGELSVSFESRVVPQRYETEAKGHARSCKMVRPAVHHLPEGGVAPASGHSVPVGNLTVRFKVWDGTEDEDLDNALWQHWGEKDSESYNGPRQEASRVLDAWGRGDSSVPSISSGMDELEHPLLRNLRPTPFSVCSPDLSDASGE